MVLIVLAVLSLLSCLLVAPGKEQDLLQQECVEFLLTVDGTVCGYAPMAGPLPSLKDCADCGSPRSRVHSHSM
jgi:hypothetical protein